MNAFTHMLVASVTILRRNTVLILSSLGLGLISILAFGWLFGSGGGLTLALGVANEGTSPAAAQVVQELKRQQGLVVSTGTEQAQLTSLRNGQRDVVLVLPANFGRELQAGQGTIQVYYNQSDPTTLGFARSAVTSIVAGLNQQLTGKPMPVVLSEQAVSVHRQGTIDFLTPGMLGLMLMWANLAVGITLVAWRKQGIMKRLAATPLRPATLISAQMVARLLLSVAQAAVLLAVAMLFFKVQVYGNWGALALVVVVGALAMMAIGFIVGSFARSEDVAQSIVFLISFPMMFLGGSYFSVAGAPSFLQPIINFLPLTHLNDALRQIINNGASLAAVQSDVLILLAWTVIGLVLATRAFRWS
ncbi:MAG: ABC transporter permease [Ktedonobacterales bacterium]